MYIYIHFLKTKNLFHNTILETIGQITYTHHNTLVWYIYMCTASEKCLWLWCCFRTRRDNIKPTYTMKSIKVLHTYYSMYRIEGKLIKQPADKNKNPKKYIFWTWYKQNSTEKKKKKPYNIPHYIICKYIVYVTWLYYT